MSFSFFSRFSEIFTSQLNESLKKYFNDIGNIWLTLGIPVDKRDEKIDNMRSKIVDQVNTFLEVETKELNDCKSYNEYKLKEINTMLQDLSLEPLVMPRNKTLIAQGKFLLTKYNELFEIKNDRFEKLEQIMEKMNKIFYSLGMDVDKPVFVTNIPSENELKTLRTKLSEHEQTLKSRRAHFESIKTIIHKLSFDLEYEISDIHDSMILSATKDTFIYSQANMNLLMEFHTKLIQLYNSSKVEIEKMFDYLKQLFSRLDVSEAEQKTFEQSLSGTFPQKKQTLTNEIEKYEIIKKNSMERIIKNIRNEIHTLLTDCMVANFDESLLECSDFTEELLIKTESEFEKLKNFKNLYQGVFEKLREWEESLEKYIELEKKSMDPNRFNNRGGALLQNERDRKMLNKKLPRLDKEIRTMVSTIEANSNFPFNTYGLDINEFFEDNWKHISISKDDAMRNLSKKLTSVESAKKGSTRSVPKSRVPFSPRGNNQLRKNVTNQRLQKNLDVDLKKAIDLELESQFQV